MKNNVFFSNALQLKFIVYLTLFQVNNVDCQNKFDDFLTPSVTFNSNRAFLAGGFATATYAAFSLSLYHAWYSKNGLGKFHYFNDHREWLQVDKTAHVFNAYFQSAYVYRAARWCGYNENHALIWSTSMSLLFQSTIEVMDGFSKDYGFSWPDMAANFAGAGFFTAQQLLWSEQKIKIKISSWPQKYSDDPIKLEPGYSFKDRALELFGNGYFNSALKDYNAQTFWLSWSPENLLNKQWTAWPDWLNISLGYGANGLYGGFKNYWVKNNIHYDLEHIPRERQYYLSLDIDFTKIKTNNAFLKTIFHLVNIIKIPAPALEYNSSGKWKGHWVFF
ncbi:MAG: DUF2279 domain-containing protein [Saprospiraceae bacterium]|nr:DUF2279 domain-containing protein [Saprospiraceae bacterium]